jgi:hypothetical protein
MMEASSRNRRAATFPDHKLSAVISRLSNSELGSSRMFEVPLDLQSITLE